MIRKLIAALALIAGTATVTLSTGAGALTRHPFRSYYTTTTGSSDVCNGAHHDEAWVVLIGKQAYNTYAGWAPTNPSQNWTRWRDLTDLERSHWEVAGTYAINYACSLEPYTPVAP